MIFAPFGMTLRACRDAPLRAEAIGIDIRTHQWLAFTIAGTFAGVAGGILAFLKGTIDPTWLAIPQSIEGLVMVLLGGVQTLAGPLVGAALYHGLEIWFSTLTRYWPLILGLIIVALVLAFPHGGVVELATAAAAGPRPLDDGPRGAGPREGVRRHPGGPGRGLRPRGRRAAGDRADGAGKTTCFNCLNGQLRADAGSVRLRPRAGRPAATRRIARPGRRPRPSRSSRPSPR